MQKLKFAEDATNPLECVDWMELVTLISPEKRCSVAAVERNLRRLTAYESSTTIQQNADIEGACAEILGENGAHKLLRTRIHLPLTIRLLSSPENSVITSPTSSVSACRGLVGKQEEETRFFLAECSKTFPNMRRKPL